GIAGIDIDAGLAVGLAVYGVLRVDGLYTADGPAPAVVPAGWITASALLGGRKPRGKILEPGPFAMAHPGVRTGLPALAGAALLLALLLPAGLALAQSTGQATGQGTGASNGQATGQPAAQTSDVFEVRDIDVDVTAQSAAAARDQAVLDGQRKALTILLGRL